MTAPIGISAAARQLKVCEATVRRYADLGLIVHERVNGRRQFNSDGLAFVTGGRLTAQQVADMRGKSVHSVYRALYHEQLKGTRVGGRWSKWWIEPGAARAWEPEPPAFRKAEDVGPPPPGYLHSSTAIEMLGVSRQRLRQLVAKGTIRAKPWRNRRLCYNRADIGRRVVEQRVAGGGNK